LHVLLGQQTVSAMCHVVLLVTSVFYSHALLYFLSKYYHYDVFMHTNCRWITDIV